MPDHDRLPPTQYLMMEVLAARYRLGERAWTFPNSCRRAAQALTDASFVWWKSAVTEGHIQVFLTAVGIAAWELDRPRTAPPGGVIMCGPPPHAEGDLKIVAEFADFLRKRGPR